MALHGEVTYLEWQPPFSVDEETFDKAAIHLDHSAMLIAVKTTIVSFEF